MEEIAVIPRRKRKLLKPKKKLHFRASYLETTPNLNLKNFASRETVAKFKELIEQEEKKKGYKTDWFNLYTTMEEIPLRRSLIHQSFPSLPKLKDKPENLLKSSENILDKKLILVSSRSISQIVIPIKAQTDRDNSTQTRLSTLQKPRILANHLAEKEKKFKVVVPSKLETSRKSNNKSPSETSQKFMSTTLIGVDLPHNTKEKLGSTSEFSVQTVKHISRISCDMTKTIAPVFFNSQIIPAKPDKKLTADEVILYMEYLNQNNNRFLI